MLRHFEIHRESPVERITAFLERTQLGDFLNLDQQKRRNTNAQYKGRQTSTKEITEGTLGSTINEFLDFAECYEASFQRN